ncbi:LacI family transcriptional regulator [Paenibacillus albidus]|uniref:LacI family transcriptional regulator n=1 Tax=Paenibacillus albidus TaxID=2041023 RepID=A0A917C3I4_9BACL|nr:LacI family DNA-binding transcriptional regulator [Paenibacillus albidus]GGF70480.1 LacI family transcriptional regulator [Paenibacillus albidus]
MVVTIKDIAEKVGVSVTTISRVLNNRGYLSDSLKKKVSEAMEEMNYQPNEVARSLLRKKSHIIGLILPDISHPFFGEVTKHIEAFAYDQGYKLMLCNSLHHKKKEKEYIDLLRASRVDGIIMGSHTMSVKDYMSINLPLVTLDRQISKSIPFIASDNYQGGVLATQLLLRKKCRKIAYLSGNLRLSLLAKQRHDAFLEQVSGQDAQFQFIVKQTDLNGFKYKEYEKLVSGLFQEHPDLDGVFASSDMLALQVLKQCRRLGKAVPDQVKVIGYDGISVGDAEDLTTIVQPIKMMGELAVRYLLLQIAGEQVPLETILPVRLSEKATT